VTWAKIDDQMTYHRKIVSAGNEAVGAWVRMLALSSAQLEDGKISREVAQTITRSAVLAKLVAVGLLDKDGDNFQIHDFLDWNPPAAEVRAKRASISAHRRAAGIKGAEARWKSHDNMDGNSQVLPLQLPMPVAGKPMAPSRSRPDPDPDPKENQIPDPKPVSPDTAKGSGKRAKGLRRMLPDDFVVSSGMETLCRKEGLPNPHDVFPNFVGKAQANAYRYADWEAAFRNWMRSQQTRSEYPPWDESVKAHNANVSEPGKPKFTQEELTFALENEPNVGLDDETLDARIDAAFDSFAEAWK
jgi:hypothetical protein